MAVRRRLQRRTLKDDELTDARRCHLLFGRVMLNGENDYPFQDAEHRESLWFLYRKELLKTYMSIFPGQRPSAWYAYEMPEARRLKTGGYFDGNGNGYRRGIPHGEGVPPARDFESERKYLTRLNLLTDLEKDTIKGSKFFDDDESLFYDRGEHFNK